MMWDLNKFKDNVALFTENKETISYATLASYTHPLKEKIPARSLILQLCKNELGSLLGYVTFLNNKIVPILLKDSVDEKTLRFFLDRYQPDYIYLPEDQKHLFDPQSEVYSKFDYCLLKTKYQNKQNRPHENLALLLTTSGSTGSPKLVRISYQNLQNNTESIASYLKINEADRTITTLPMNYTYGLSVINSYLYAGASILLSSKTMMQKEFWHQLSAHKITSISGVPYTYEMLDKMRLTKMNLPNLKTLTQAGGKLQSNLHKKFADWAQENKKGFVVMYGQTEATARMSYLPSNKSAEKVGSIGIAIPGGKFEIVDHNGQTIEGIETPGELIYKGKNVALGYADTVEHLSLGDEFKETLHTGDIAQKDKDGYLYIVGRKKRFLKIFGNRVNLDEAELLVKEKFSISECACAGYDDKMFIFICDESLQKNILEYITKITALNPIAFKFVVLKNIPKNDAGKTLYQDLESYYD